MAQSPRTIRKPRTAWQCFQANKDVRTQLPTEVRESGDFRTISRSLGQLWKSMDTEARQPYQLLAAEDREHIMSESEPETESEQEPVSDHEQEPVSDHEQEPVSDSVNHTSRTPYEQFLMDSSAEVQQQHPDWSFQQILDLLDTRWKQHQVTPTLEKYQTLDASFRDLTKSHQQLVESHRQLVQKNSELVKQQISLSELIARNEAVKQSHATALVFRSQRREQQLQQTIRKLKKQKPDQTMSEPGFNPWNLFIFGCWAYMSNMIDYSNNMVDTCHNQTTDTTGIDCGGMIE
jgi:hypothetical protein